MISRLIFSVLLLVVFVPDAMAQPMDQPTPQQLFEAAREAMGKPSEGVGSVEATARVTVRDPEGDDYGYQTIVRGIITADSLGDASFTMIEGEDKVTYGETDGAIWFEGADGNRRDLVPGMAKFVRGHQFHRRILAPELEYKTISADVQEQEFAGARVFVVSGTTHADALLKYYYDIRSKLPVGMHLTVQTDQGPQPMDMVLKDWRTSAGQSLFWGIDILDRGKTYEYRFDRILLLP